MREPTFDRDGYPTEETLQAIRDWDIATFADAAAAMDFAGRAWYYPDRWHCQPRWRGKGYKGYRRRYVFSTGGWSGNESVAGAIKENLLLEMLGAWSWRRGGHYEYRFPC